MNSAEQNWPNEIWTVVNKLRTVLKFVAPCVSLSPSQINACLFLYVW